MLGNIEDEKVCSSAPGAHILLQPRGGLQVAEWQSGRLGWSHSSVGDDEASEACMYVCTYLGINTTVSQTRTSHVWQPIYQPHYVCSYVVRYPGTLAQPAE